MENHRHLIHILTENRWGGMTRYALDICRHYKSLGWNVVAFTRDAKAVDSLFRERGNQPSSCPILRNIGFQFGKDACPRFRHFACRVGGGSRPRIQECLHRLACPQACGKERRAHRDDAPQSKERDRFMAVPTDIPQSRRHDFRIAHCGRTVSFHMAWA